MCSSFEAVCEKCHAELIVSETEVEFEGGKEKEQAKCPQCGYVAYEAMTNGFLHATLKN